MKYVVLLKMEVGGSARLREMLLKHNFTLFLVEKASGDHTWLDAGLLEKIILLEQDAYYYEAIYNSKDDFPPQNIFQEAKKSPCVTTLKLEMATN